MKSEKLSTEIAALQRKQKETKNAVAKKALSSKIERLKKELDEITTSAQAKTALAKAQSKIREMSQKDFGEFVKKLAAKPEFSFLKGMSKSKIKDDIMRVAKPVGWRFRGRTNVKKPTKKDIQEGNNVYYEGRVNRSDVSRTVRLAEGGGVGRYYGGEYITDNDLMKLKNFEIVEKDRIRITPQSNEYGTRFGYDIEYLDENGKWEGSHSVSAYSKGEAFEKLKNKFQGKEYAKGGGVSDEISLAIKYGKMLNDLNKEKQFNKKIELNSALKNFEKQNEISIDSNNVISVKGNKVAYIDKINAKTGQPKTNWDIKKYAKGGKTDFGMLSVKAGIDNNPNPTYADKIAGAKMNKMAEGGGVKYPTDLKVGTVLEGVGFPMLKGIDGGNYYTIVEMDNYSATLTKSDKNGNKKGSKKVRHYLSSIEGAIKTASRGDENGILVVKYAKGGGVDMESVEEEIRSLRSRIKSLKEINTKEAYEQLYELTRQLSYLQAKLLHIKDLGYAKGGGVGGKKINYDAYDNKSIDYVEGEIVHTERSARAFRNEGNLAEAEDRENHAKKLWEIYYKKRKEAKYATGGGVGLVNYGDYSPTVSYKIPDEELSNFIDYVYDVYKEQGYTKMQVKNAVNRYLSDLDKQYTWGYGDSLDRERVYEYLLNPKLKGIQNPSLAKGGDVQSSEPHRLHMMAKGGMTFSESVLKEGLSDMLQHLYKAQNELDGIMGYLDRTGQGGMKSALKSKFGLNSISETTEKIDTYLDK